MRSPGVVELGVVAPLGYSVEVSHDGDIFLFQGDDAVSSDVLLTFDVLQTSSFLQGFQLFFLVESL